MDVLTKVKGQMRTKMKEEIISDSKFGSGDNMANRIDRGTTRVAMLGVFFMFLLAPQLANPPDKCDVDIGGISGFKMLKARVKAVGNVAGTDTISDSDCEDLVKSDEAIQSMVYEYRLLDPEPFLIRFYDCTLHMNSDFVQYGNNGKLQVTNLRSIFVGHVPCAHNEFEHTSTMVAFDLRKVRREEAYYHIALSISLITLLFVLSYALGRDTAMLTEVIVSPLTQLAKDMDRVSRFDLTTRRRTGSRGSGKLAKSARDSLRRSVSGNHLLGEDDDPESSIAEVRSIQQSFVRMRTTIQSFAKYVPQDVVYQLVRAKAGMAKLAVEEQ